MNSLKQINHENQLPTELKEIFIELKVLKHLRQAGIKRKLGFACSYIFQILFCLLFQHRNWFRMQESERKNVDYPSKDTVYRFLNCPNFAWQRFLSSFSSHVIEKVIPLKAQTQTRVLIKRAKSNILDLFPETTLPLEEGERKYKYGQFGYGKYIYQKQEMNEMQDYMKTELARFFPQAKVWLNWGMKLMKPGATRICVGAGSS